MVTTLKNIQFSLKMFFSYSDPLGFREGSDLPGPRPINEHLVLRGRSQTTFTARGGHEMSTLLNKSY